MTKPLTIKDAFAQLIGHVVVQLREATAARRFQDAVTWAQVGLLVVLVDEKVHKIVTDAGKPSSPFTATDINGTVRISSKYEGVNAWARGHVGRVASVSERGLILVQVGEQKIWIESAFLERGIYVQVWEPSV